MRAGLVGKVWQTFTGSRRIRLAVALLLAVLLSDSCFSLCASAQSSTCRSDPIVRLSNNSQLDLTAVIGAPFPDVRRITYTLHAPVGTSITGITYTNGLFSKREFFTFVADAAPNTYTTDTVVYTVRHGNTVQATTALHVSETERASQTTSGLDNQNLVIHLTG